MACRIFHCGAHCGAWAAENAGSVVVAHGLSCPGACGNLVPRPGIKPVSPALEGGFLPNGPPGKAQEGICFKETVSSDLSPYPSGLASIGQEVVHLPLRRRPKAT